MGGLLLSSVKTVSYGTKAGKKGVFTGGRAFGWVLASRMFYLKR